MKLSRFFTPTLISILLLSACTVPTEQRPSLQTPDTTQTTAPISISKGSRYYGTVVKVADGDTLTVHDTQGGKHKIRLAYVDAPELKQNYGENSRDALNQLVGNQQVQIVVTDIDRYQREVAYVYHNQKDVNYRQVELGNAWHYLDYAKNQEPSEYQRYQNAQAEAKAKKLGLWQFPRPVAPWDYRKQQRQKATSAN